MHRRPTTLVLALVAPLLAFVPVTTAHADEDPAAVATRDLRQDAEAGVTLSRGDDGQVAFVGTPARGSIDNPEVDADDSVRSAAREHLDRYGAALEPAADSTFAQTATFRSSSGVDLVRYQQSVDGVRVLGGQVVVGLDADRGLRSMTSSVAGDDGTEVGTPRISAAEAERAAREAVSRRGTGAALAVTDQGRWILDPAVAGLDLPGGTRTVRKLEVGDGAAVRELVLVDDRTGAVVFSTSLIAEADRVVCDKNNVRGPLTLCTSGFARTETGPASAVSDVNKAFQFAGETADLYAAYAPPKYQNLTALLGLNTGTEDNPRLRLASTVRFCSDTQSDGTTYDEGCPYDNAFWNGQQMYYGAGFAAADDVVGHEMTHGYTERTSGLFYWGQSGAINESMSDVIGEIIDHRHGTETGSDDDSAWELGEDLPGSYALRSMSNPTTNPNPVLPGYPDAMTSPLYDADSDATDNGGVHANSGVGNKTAYLISQGTGGASVNGQTFTGIDAGDPGLAKTAVLYLEVIPRLVGASDYADLAATLDQTCQDLRAQGTVRGVSFTAADCTRVHQATLATALTSPPANITKPADASTACPTGTAKRVLFTSEGANAASAMTPDPSPAGPVDDPDGLYAWYRDVDLLWFRSATWSVPDPGFSAANTLRVADPVALPAGQQSFLSFRGWWVNDFVPPAPAGEDPDPYTGDYDGGSVELDVAGQGTTIPVDGWVNGPAGTLVEDPTLDDGGDPAYPNPYAGRKAFTGDSHGWVVSTLDLTDYAASSVQPRFTMLSDAAVGHLGWFLDDITVYTCDTRLAAPPGASMTGGLNAVTVRWGSSGQDISGYRVRVAGYARTWTFAASARSATLTGLTTRASSVQVYVQAVKAGMAGSPEASRVLNRGLVTVAGKRVGSKVTFTGTVKAAGRPVAGGVVRLERKSGGRWLTVKSVRTRTNGAWTVKVVRKPKAVYRATYLGSTSLIGTTSATSLRR